MTQFESNPYAHPEDMLHDDAKTHGLAIGSLVCSLVCCIPFLGLLGALLGVFGVMAISRDPVRYKGKGMAIAGIIIGLIVGLVWLPGAYFGWKGVSYAMEIGQFVKNGIPSHVMAGGQGDYAKFLDGFVDKTLSEADATAYFTELEGRYGAIRSVSIDPQQQQQQAQPGQPEFDMDYIVTFADDSTHVMQAHIQVANPNATGWNDAFGYGLIRITVEDADAGDLTFP
ncbi:MAG: DUF4190 domain-containing protein [Phycisphaerales bacterium]|nr:DUF4190 domain-containing protein [Phycisphaerales bacterium]